MVKPSELPPDTAPTTDDYAVVNDATGPATKRVTLANLITLFFNNIPSGAPSPVTRFNEALADFVASGGVWSGDNYSVSRNASMTAMIVYINGQRISIGAVTSRAFTASKDTYVDVLDNADGTGTLVYTEVANGAAAPALAANSLRIAKIVTDATDIQAASSITQWGAPDSLGNMIQNKSPFLGHAIVQVARRGGSATNWNSAGTTDYDTRGTNIIEQSGTTANDASPKTHTFPRAFSQIPQVFVQIITAVAANCYQACSSLSTTGFTCQVITDAGAGNTAQTINWLARGV